MLPTDFKRSQYEYKLREWGFKKYPMGAAEWRYIKRQLEKRKRESGKGSDVYVNGILQHPRKVRYEIGRQGFESTIAKFQENPFLKIPPGIEIRTPTPPALKKRPRPYFPWFEYSRGFPTLTYWNGSSSSPSAEQQSKLKSMMIYMLDSVLTKCPMAYETQAQSISRASSVLNVLVPEEYDGQNTSTAAKLMSDPRTNFLECIRLLMFLLSNKIHLELYDPSAISINPARLANMHIMDMLSVAGLLSEHHLISMMKGQPTMRAIVEKVFDIALSCVNIQVLRLLMQAGISPNKPVSLPRVNEFGDESILQIALPLEIAAQVQSENECIELSRLLLSFKANINGYKQQAPLSIAVKARRHRIAEFFLKNGARATRLDLIHAVTCQDIKLLQLLLDTAGLDVDTVFDTPMIPKITPLGYASSIGNHFMARMFLRRGANPNFEQITVFEGELFRTTPLGLASGHGHVEVMDLLLKSSANINPHHGAEAWIPHLVAAVSNCHLKATRILLSAGANIEVANNFRLKTDTRATTLIERAQAQQGMDLYRILLDAGATVHQSAMQNFLSLQMMWYWKHRNAKELFELLNIAKQSQIYAKDLNHDSPENFIQSMIQKNGCDVPRLLRLAGAPISGRQAPLSLDAPTAVLLDDLGILSDVLSTNGQMILINAILAEDESLVRLLLPRVAVDNAVEHAQKEEQWPTASPPIFPCCKSPLDAALYRRNLDLAEDLIQRGASISESELKTVIWQACLKNDISLAQKFIGTLARQFQAPTAMAVAIRAKQDTLVYLLLDAGFSPKGQVAWPGPNIILEEPEENTDWWNSSTTEPQSSLIEVLAKIGNRTMLNVLLRKVSWTPEEKGSALAASIRCNNNEQIIVDLLNANAAINSDTIIAAFELQDISLVRKFIATGTDLGPSSAELDSLHTTLEQAVNSNNIELVKLIIGSGADVNKPASHGATALQIAVKNGSMAMVKTLLDAGADPNGKPATVDGADALQIAATNGFIGIAYQLFDRGATVNKTSLRDASKSALILAAENGRLDMLQLLLCEENTAQDTHQVQLVRAVAAAEERGHYAVAGFLKGNIR